jgi:hypothetical protein
MTRDSTSNVLDSIPLWASLRDSKGQRADKTLIALELSINHLWAS